jgi:hypothetical protein
LLWTPQAWSQGMGLLLVLAETERTLT